MSFSLHPILKKDCIKLGRLELCHVLLMNDSQFPWLILVPERKNISEIHQLTDDDQQQLMLESGYIAEQLTILFEADKMNIAALGNMVPQPLSAPDGLIVSRRRREICQSEVRDSARGRLKFYPE
ncbi:hypothetical protein BJAS_P1982 [Bathymodiolus japonicus methanotrophic gill symbiont]|nr:hypothetical protein BJAS_P1982 [Bathymodiolus japonicus methanotrophic gill symbiont]